MQAPVPAHLIHSGMPTEATVANVILGKYPDHLPLWRHPYLHRSLTGEKTPSQLGLAPRLARPHSSHRDNSISIPTDNHWKQASDMLLKVDVIADVTRTEPLPHTQKRSILGVAMTAHRMGFPKAIAALKVNRVHPMGLGMVRPPCWAVFPNENIYLPARVRRWTHPCRPRILPPPPSSGYPPLSIFRSRS